MRILDIVETYPQTESVFSSYDEMIGKCMMCNHLFDSLAEIAQAYHLDSKELLLKLNQIIAKDQ